MTEPSVESSSESARERSGVRRLAEAMRGLSRRLRDEVEDLRGLAREMELEAKRILGSAEAIEKQADQADRMAEILAPSRGDGRERSSRAGRSAEEVEVPGYLGVALYRDESQGLRVKEVLPGGGAADADIRPGDVILSIGNREVRTRGELHDALGSRAAGEQVTIVVERDGESSAVPVTLRAQPGR